VLEPAEIRHSEDYDQTVKDMEDGITAMKQAGWPLGTYPFWRMYQNLLGGQTGKQDIAAALKTCLTIYYLVEPAQQRSEHRFEERIGTLYNLVSFLGPQLTYHRGLLYHLTREKLPEDVQKLANLVYHHLRAKLAGGIQQCFGEDSGVGKAEFAIFCLELEDCKNAEKSKQKFEYIPLVGYGEQQRKESKKFSDNMNKILAWAGIPQQFLLLAMLRLVMLSSLLRSERL
jgi:hypothetical protein